MKVVSKEISIVFLWPFGKIRIIIVIKSGLQTTDMRFSPKEHENPSKYFQHISQKDPMSTSKVQCPGGKITYTHQTTSHYLV